MKKFLYIVIAVAYLLSIIGCSSSSVKEVRLYDNKFTTIDKTANPQGQYPLRVAVSSILSPRETLTVYQSLLDYLEAKLGRPVVLLQRRTYKEVNELVQNNGADIAFVCSGGYVAGNYSYGLELLAMPEVNGQLTYQSYIIAGMRVTAESIDDLRGRSFAFTDPMSFSGRIAPVYMITSRGYDSGDFFGRTFFTYSHDNAIKSVAEGIVDAAAVDSMIYDQACSKNPDLQKHLKVIDRSLMVGNPPVVVNKSLDFAEKERLRSLVLDMHRDKQGLVALTALKYDRFILPNDNLYWELKNIWQATKEKL